MTHLPDLSKLTPRDKTFLDCVVQIIEAHLSEADFSVEKLCSEAGYSRSQLHRKLIAVTSLSASRLILTRRLQAAETLLKTAPLTVGNIGRQCGFNNASYFSKSFREMYGMTPSEYIK